MHLFFSTPIWINKISNHESINTELKKFIYNQREKNPEGTQKSNINGWHSEEFDLKNENLKNFISEISKNIGSAVKDMGWDLETQIVKITSMWSIINNKDAFNEKHHHGNSALSAAYYIKAEQNAGNIVFYDPRQANVFHHPVSKEVNVVNAQVQSVTPKAGTLVLFPSYLEHKVNPNLSNDERIVISFNIALIRKKDIL
ncbi:TIGR02466 family protein [Pelagibacteraceae bacterium]|nr:TIGR02466 family protein [Pelagibacteraceae bacterium]